MKDTPSESEYERINNVENMDQNNESKQEIGTFRRILPQFLATSAKNIMIFNMGNFLSFPTIVIPSLSGINHELNPHEMVHVTAAQTSWLSSSAHIAHPIGSLLSGPICDRIGRRKAIMAVTIPLLTAWIMLNQAQSFPIICFGFTLLGFGLGLKESPCLTYMSEINEPMIRGTMMMFSIFVFNIGVFVVLAAGAILPWRQVALICAVVPFLCMIAVFFVPESPAWLLSKGRSKDALKSLRWLRGWVSPQTVHDEFTELKQFNSVSNACVSCVKQSIKCYHTKVTFADKMKELKRKRSLKPCLLVFCLQFFAEFSCAYVWRPYMIQVLNALGTPIKASWIAVVNGAIGIITGILLIFVVKRLGRRKIYLTSISLVTLCTFALGIYCLVFFPSNWISFKNPDETAKDPQLIREIVGDYCYLALALFLLLQFAMRIGVGGIPHMYLSEVFPFKSRSYLCGIATANQYILTSIATKTYYNIEMWLSLPGAILFYGTISFIGLIVMYKILPETEQRSLAEIERHFSDNSKGLTDIYICKHEKIINEINE